MKMPAGTRVLDEAACEQCDSLANYGHGLELCRAAAVIEVPYNDQRNVRPSRFCGPHFQRFKHNVEAADEAANGAQ